MKCVCRVVPSQWAVAVCLATLLLQCDMLRAQQGGPSSTTDLYGNARPVYRERRLMGLYQNDLQRSALRGAQNFGRRANRRGGQAPFSLPADRSLSFRQGGAGPLSFTNSRTSSLGHAMPSPLAGPSRVARDLQYAFRSYGGFGERQEVASGGLLADALQRRILLSRATGLNAPVQRAMWERGLIIQATTPVSWDPFVQREETEWSEELTELSPSLDDRVTDAHATSVRTAWSAFSDGNFRRSCRAFDTASMLDTSDHESRVGVVLSHLGLSAVRTSVAYLNSLARRDPNPFQYYLHLDEKLESEAMRRDLRLRAELFAQANTDAAAPQALNMLVLWHLGDAAGARLAAGPLVRVGKDSLFSGWPDLLEAAVEQRKDPIH